MKFPIKGTVVHALIQELSGKRLGANVALETLLKRVAPLLEELEHSRLIMSQQRQRIEQLETLANDCSRNASGNAARLRDVVSEVAVYSWSDRGYEVDPDWTVREAVPRLIKCLREQSEQAEGVVTSQRETIDRQHDKLAKANAELDAYHDLILSPEELQLVVNHALKRIVGFLDRDPD